MIYYGIYPETEEDVKLNRAREVAREKKREEAICSKLKEFEPLDTKELSDLLLTHYKAEKQNALHEGAWWVSAFVGQGGFPFSFAIYQYMTSKEMPAAAMIAVGCISILPMIGMHIWDCMTGYLKRPGICSEENEIKAQALLRLYSSRHDVDVSKVKSHVYQSAV